MTFALARKFADIIIVISDTMISGRGLARPDTIPGRLKSIVINGQVSIAYAGSADAALDAVRHAKRLLHQSKSLDDIIEYLRDKTVELPDTEFIISSHLAGIRLVKIWKGLLSEDSETFWIGNPKIEALLRIKEAEIARTNTGLSEATLFETAAMTLGQTPGAWREEGIGGFIVNQLGTPDGHCYQSHSAAAAFDTIQIPPGITQKQAENRNSGMTMYVYNVLAPRNRGVAVLGAYLNQRKIGYVYSPLESDSPETLYPATLELVSNQVKRLSQDLGGFLSEKDR